MKQMTPRRMAEECGGRLLTAPGYEDAAVREVVSIEIDSRKVQPGGMFAAMVGKRVNGNDYIPQVVQAGVTCVLTEMDIPLETAPCQIRVKDAQWALGEIARAYRMALGTKVVGITGSVGKTSTKEMVASVLSQKFCTLRTPGNFNNELGLPLTIFGLNESHEAAVLEMGMNHFGEMHHLAQIARPNICLITNIGECHLEYLGDRAGVLKAKSEIFDFLEGDETIILNGNDDMLTRLSNVHGITPIFYGLPGKEEGGVELSVYADEIKSQGLSGISCRIHTPQGSFEACIPIPGEHMVMNALAGTAVGLACGLTIEQIKRGIESVSPVSGRLNQVKTARYGTIIDDCYNANPMSMRASLQVLKDAGGRRVAILGDMMELGENEMEYHAQLGRFAADCHLDVLIGIGTRSRCLIDAAKECNPQQVCAHFDTAEDFLKVKDEYLTSEETVLVKASHSMNFTAIIEALSQNE